MKWAHNEFLLLWTSKMSIDMAGCIVHWYRMIKYNQVKYSQNFISATSFKGRQWGWLIGDSISNGQSSSRVLFLHFDCFWFTDLKKKDRFSKRDSCHPFLLIGLACSFTHSTISMDSISTKNKKPLKGQLDDQKLPPPYIVEHGTCFDIVLCWMFLGPAIWIDGFANFGHISVSTIDLLGPGQHSFGIEFGNLSLGHKCRNQKTGFFQKEWPWVIITLVRLMSDDAFMETSQETVKSFYCQIVFPCYNIWTKLS